MDFSVLDNLDDDDMIAFQQFRTSDVVDVYNDAAIDLELDTFDEDYETIFRKPNYFDEDFETNIDTFEEDFETSIDNRNYIGHRTSSRIQGGRPVRSKRSANMVTRQFERDFFKHHSIASRPLRALQGDVRSRFVSTDLPSAIESPPPINSFINELTSDSSFASLDSSSTFIYPEDSSIVPLVDMSETVPKVPFPPAPAPVSVPTRLIDETVPIKEGFQLFSHATGTVLTPLLGFFGLSVAALLSTQFPAATVNKVVTSTAKYVGIIKQHIPEIESVLQGIDLSTTAAVLSFVYDLDVMLYNRFVKKKYGTINLQILLSDEQHTGLNTLEQHRQDSLTLLLEENLRSVPITKEGSTLKALLDTRNFLTGKPR